MQSANICGSYEYELTPALGFITIANGFLRLRTTSANDIGSYEVQLEVQLQNYPDVKQKYPFIVDVCDSAILVFSQTPELTSYTRGQGLYESSTLIATPTEVCRQKTVFSVEYITSAGPVASLGFMSFSEDKFILETDKVEDVGSYEVLITATSINQQS